jgi:short-subunit dehydrogenase
MAARQRSRGDEVDVGEFVDRFGPWALVIGGSEGIGASFARRLAAAGSNVVVVARKPGPLADVAAEVRESGVEARTVSADLSAPDSLDRVREATDDVEVGLLIYNAGANSVRGNFLDLDPDVYRNVIAINVVGQAEFVHHYGGLMQARGRGGMILAGSSSNFLGAPTLAAYTGAKAFSRIFSEALWSECKPVGVDVLHIVVHFTATPAMERLGYDLTTAQAPDEVAGLALDNIRNGPILILGGEAGWKQAVERSVLVNRGEVIETVATPRR